MSHVTKKPTARFGLMRIERCDACDAFYQAVDGHDCPEGDDVPPALPKTQDQWSAERLIPCLRCGATMAVLPPDQHHGIFPWCPACWGKAKTGRGLPIHPHWRVPGPKEQGA